MLRLLAGDQTVGGGVYSKVVPVLLTDLFTPQGPSHYSQHTVPELQPEVDDQQDAFVPRDASLSGLEDPRTFQARH